MTDVPTDPLIAKSIPKDLDLVVEPRFYDEAKAQALFLTLREGINWRQEKIRIMGKMMAQPRLIAWYGEPEAVYTYSGLTLSPEPWTKELSEIRSDLEAFAGTKFNSVLLNLYRSGSDHMGWHSDNEKELGVNPTIASLSLGATRRFLLRHRQEELETVSLDLESGALLLMRGETQTYWRHKIAATKKDVGERINLTFRMINRQ